MNAREEFFILSSEYRMLANRIRTLHSKGVGLKNVEMTEVINTYNELGSVLDEKIKEFLPKLLEKVPDAQEQLYNKFKIKQV